MAPTLSDRTGRQRTSFEQRERIREARRHCASQSNDNYSDLDRLVGAEVWLVEELPNGKEQSQSPGCVLGSDLQCN
jgi:hypothetical protein